MSRDSVVGARLCAPGLAEASTMPLIPTARTMATPLPVGEKAARMPTVDNA